MASWPSKQSTVRQPDASAKATTRPISAVIRRPCASDDHQVGTNSSATDAAAANETDSVKAIRLGSPSASLGDAIRQFRQSIETHDAGQRLELIIGRGRGAKRSLDVRDQLPDTGSPKGHQRLQKGSCGLSSHDSAP